MNPQISFSATLDLAREPNESVAIAESLYWLGSTLSWLGDAQRARALAEESVSLWLQLGKPWATCRPLGILAKLAMTTGNYQQAIALHEERLRYACEVADSLQVARIHGSLGLLAAEQVQVDGGDWLPATIDDGQDSEFAWKLWSLNWANPAAGEHTITSRAIGIDGHIQPAQDDPWITGKHTFWESNGQVTRRVRIP